MRYANQIGPLEREAAREAMRQQIRPGMGNEGFADNPEQINNLNDAQVNNLDPPHDDLLLDDDESEELREQHQQLLQEQLQQQLQQQQEQQQHLQASQEQQHEIPVPIPRNGRRPYHELARENSEALNVLPAREISVLTNQLQQTMKLINLLIRRQLDNLNTLLFCCNG